MSKYRNRKVQGANRQGAVTVEFALVAPIILMLFFGSVELTRLNFLRHTAANAAYEAARASIVPGATASDGHAEASQLLQAVGANSGVSISVNTTTDAVEATVSIPVEQNSWGLGRFTSGITLVESCTLRREVTQ